MILPEAKCTILPVCFWTLASALLSFWNLDCDCCGWTCLTLLGIGHFAKAEAEHDNRSRYSANKALIFFVGPSIFKARVKPIAMSWEFRSQVIAWWVIRQIYLPPSYPLLASLYVALPPSMSCILTVLSPLRMTSLEPSIPKLCS